MNLLFKTEQAKREYLSTRIKRFYPTFQNGGQIFRDLITQNKNTNAVILDAGCGDGGVLTQYKNQFQKLIGVDNNLDLLTNNSHLDEKIHADLSSIPLPDTCIDLVISDFVLEHIQNPESVFQEIYRILKPSGVFLFRTTNVYNPVMWLSKLLPLFLHKTLREKILKKQEETHETFYRANTWSTLVHHGKKSGFSSTQLFRAGNPEYLSFSPITVVPALLFERCFDLPKCAWLKMYLIGHYKK